VLSSRLNPNNLLKNRYNLFIENEVGVDEVGVGCLMGPVYAAAVLLPKEFTNSTITDSKKLNFNTIESLAHLIMDESIAYGVAYATAEEIDEFNILQATYLAMNRAIDIVNEKVDIQYLIIDGNRFNGSEHSHHTCIVKGDSKYTSIAAASILAKYNRDKFIMETAHNEFPDYNWVKNKGYGTKDHILAIKEHGYTHYHRKTFNPLKTLINEQEVYPNIF